MPPSSNASHFLLYLGQLQHPSPSFRAGSMGWSCLRCRRHYAMKTRPRNGEPFLSDKPFLSDNPGQSPTAPAADLASSSHISGIIMGTEHCGARVSRSGELEITSEELSRRPHQTALVVTRASPTLTEYDFRTVVEQQGEDRGGLREVLPLRDPQSLKRFDSWVLIFSSPADAKRYQQTVSKVQKLHSKRSPVPDPTAMNTIPNLPSVNGTKSYRFSATTPFQRLSFAARLYPYGSKLADAISAQRELARTANIGVLVFPVRLCVPKRADLSVEYIKKLLHLDGLSRGRAWAVAKSEGAISRVDRDATSRYQGGHDNWRIDFSSASDAAQFARTWHRRSLPMLEDSKGKVILNTECLF